MGDFSNCEAAYVRYIKVIENNFGEDSAENSNAYFFVGVFYLENVTLLLIFICFNYFRNIYQRQQHALGKL